MLNPFSGDVTPNEQSPRRTRPTYLALLPVLLYVLVTVSFLVMAIRVPDIVAAALFATAAMVSLGAGFILGLSVWIFPEFPRSPAQLPEQQ